MKAYYLVSYGHTTRWSEKVLSPEQAMLYCYGMVAPSRMATVFSTRKPCYLTLKQKQKLHDELKKKQDALDEKLRDKPARRIMSAENDQ